MFRTSLSTVLVLAVLVGSASATEIIKATVVSYDQDTMKLVATVGDKERTFELKKSTHVHDVDGKEVRVQDRPAKLKKGTKIEVEQEKNKIIEINIKK